MNVISQSQIIKWLEKTAKVVKDNKEYLTELDSAIGDADHGFNMERGFNKVMGKIDEFLSTDDIGAILKNTGMTLISSIGGASGPLYGSFFLQAGAISVSKSELSLKDLKDAVEKGVEAVKARGRASVGEKTMIDVLDPALQSLNKSVETNESLETALSNMIDAADKGMKSTINMIARKGRASYLGERSIGHQDPGATSSYLILNALKEVVTSSKN